MCTQLCKTFAEWNLFHEFKKLTVLRSRLKFDSFAGLPLGTPEAIPKAAPRRPGEGSSLAGARILDNAEGGG